MRPLLPLLAALLPPLVLGCLPLPAQAEIYRWVDAQGLVHFTQNPPPHGAYQNVTPPPAAIASPGPQIHAKPASSLGADSGKTRQAAQATQASLKSKADNAERCAKARERVSFLEEKTAHRLFKTGDDGQPARLTEEEFQQQLDDANGAAKKYCD